jgi:uncharacterized protein with HEPN domain
MSKNKNDRYYAEKLLVYIQKALSISKHIDFSSPSSNEVGLFAVNFCLIEMREIAGKLTSSFLQSHPEIDLPSLIAFRNVLAHDYGQVDFSAYRSLIAQDLPKMEKELFKYVHFLSE